MVNIWDDRKIGRKKNRARRGLNLVIAVLRKACGGSLGCERDDSQLVSLWVGMHDCEEMRRRASTTRKMLGWKTMATERNNADWPTQRRFVIRSIPKAVVDQLHVRVAEMRLLDP